MAGSFAIAPSVQSPKAFARNNMVNRFKISAGETANGLSESSLLLGREVGDIERHIANAIPATTDMAVAFQRAIDSADAQYPKVKFSQQAAISKPLLIRTTTTANLSITGDARVTAIISPLAADIKQAPQNVNALIINQNNNPHLHLQSLRCIDAAAYTGIFLYCTEGGAGDASGQALFSAVIDDCWFSFSTNNTGYFRGGFSNLRVSKTVFESAKNACFRLEGVGNADQQYIGNVMNACYDSFILGTDDTQTKADITVDVLHSYQHLRGPLIEAKNVVNSIFTNIIEEPDAANVGTTGILKLTDSAGITGHNLKMRSRSGIPRGSCCLEFINGATGKYSNVDTDATTGIRFSGTGVLDLTFDNCDFSGCDNAVQWLSGTLSGKIRFRNCKLNDSQLYGLLVSAGTMSFDLTIQGGEIVNAGLGGVATNRNLDINTSGAVRLIGVKMGQDNGSAAAASYVRANGSGTFEIIDPIIVGTPPTSFLDGSNTQTVSFDGVDSSMPGMPAFVPSLGGSATYTAQQGHWSIKKKKLHFHGRLTVNAIGTGSASNISGFPFTSHASIYGGGVVQHFAGVNVLAVSMNLRIAPAGTTAVIVGLTAAAAATGTLNAMTSGTDIIFHGSYPLP